MTERTTEGVGHTSAVIGIHPAARLFPLLDRAAFAALVYDIRQHGLREPIVTFEGKILDGRNRQRACAEAGVEPRFVEWDGQGGSPTAYVVSKNIHRRHLTISQKVMLAQKILPRLESEARKRQGARTDLTSGQSCPDVDLSGGRARRQAAALVGCSERYVQDGKRIEQTDPALAQEIREGTLTLSQANRALKERTKAARREVNTAATRAVPTATSLVGAARFATILADPPWDWQDEGYESAFGRKQPPYATMRLDAIRALPVPDLADRDAHVYLWVTNRILALGHGHALLETWGFRFGSLITWTKPSIGLGSYFRNSTEHCLLGVRGQQALLRHDVGTWFTAPAGPRGHSSKPEEIYELIESCSPGPYLEMFARNQRAGWTAWGAESPSSPVAQEATATGEVAP